MKDIYYKYSKTRLKRTPRDRDILFVITVVRYKQGFIISILSITHKIFLFRGIVDDIFDCLLINKFLLFVITIIYHRLRKGTIIKETYILNIIHIFENFYLVDKMKNFVCYTRAIIHGIRPNSLQFFMRNNRVSL